jgi:hypothetical protein
MSGRIGQQIYTRERRGLFRGSEGYDSIAKSANLSDAFVKDSIHPYCGYSPSRKLQTEGAPPEDYPYAYTVARCPDGRTLVGRTVYVAADFTGQRATFFSHNYILPAEYEFSPEDLLRVEFLSEYDISRGRELPELDELPIKAAALYESEPAFITDGQLAALEGNQQAVSDVFVSLGLFKAKFAVLISFILQSVSGTRKIFLQVPLGPRDTSNYAIRLLGALLSFIPPTAAKSLGFLTYAREPENKKGLHIIFLENGTVRKGDPRIARDFFLDMALDVTGDASSPFISFLWHNRDDFALRDGFYRFADAFAPELTLTHWDDLLEIYEILRADNLQEEPDVFQTVCRALCNAALTEPEKAGYAVTLARRVETRLFVDYINYLIESGNTAVFMNYAAECLRLPPKVVFFFTELRFWLANIPAVSKLPDFTKQIYEKAAAFMVETDDPIGMAKTFYGFIKELLDMGMKELAIGLADVTDTRLTPRLDLHTVTRLQLTALPGAFIARGKASEDPQVYFVLEILIKVSHSLDSDANFSLRQFVSSYTLSDESQEIILSRLKEFYSGYARQPHFENISALMDVPDLLNYVQTYGANGETRAAFLIWALEAKKILPGGPDWEAVKKFIKANIKDGAFKDKIYINPTLKTAARELRFGRLYSRA